MLSRDEQLNSNWGTICTLVEMETADGKKRKVKLVTILKAKLAKEGSELSQIMGQLKHKLFESKRKN